MISKNWVIPFLGILNEKLNFCSQKATAHLSHVRWTILGCEGMGCGIIGVAYQIAMGTCITFSCFARTLGSWTML